MSSWSIVLVVTDSRDAFVRSGIVPGAIASLDRIRTAFDLVIVNNWETAKSPRMTGFLRAVARDRPNTKVIELETNHGSSGAFNAGVRAAPPSDYLVVMSEDAEVVDPDILSKMERVFQAHPRVGSAHPLAIHEDADGYNVSGRYGDSAFYRRLARLEAGDPVDRLVPSEAEIRKLTSKVHARRPGIRAPMESIPLTFTGVRRGLFEHIGGFDEKLFFCHENNDFTYRMLRENYVASCLTNSFVHHRRLLLRAALKSAAGVEGMGPSSVQRDDAKIEATAAHWNSKWGMPARDVFGELRFGPRTYRLIRPGLRVTSWIRRTARSLWA